MPFPLHLAQPCGWLDSTDPNEGMAPIGVVPGSVPLRFVRKGYAARHVLERAIFERDGSWDCFYCGRSANSIDHVTARFKGGSETIDNLVFACWACNDEKNTQPGWLYALKRCWDYGWPDPFVKPSIQWTLTYSEAA